MNADTPALVARARGLRQHLPPLAGLNALAAIESPAELLAALAQRHLLPAGAPGRDAVEALEIGFRERAAEMFAILQRWRGRGRDVLALIFAEEERRCLRALLRGAAAGAAPEVRLAGLIPTPELPLRRLDDLARAADPVDVALRLARFGWPDAAALARDLARAAAATRPDLAAMERTLRARFGRRLHEAARRGDRELRREIALAVDLDNAVAATALAGGGHGASDDDFLPGGSELPRALFARAAESESPGAALTLLAHAFADAAIVRALRASLTSPARLGERLVTARLARARADAALRPLGAAPVLELALLLRAEGMAISRLVWGLALDAPAGARRGAAA